MTQGRTGGLLGVLGVVIPAAGLPVLPIWTFPGTTTGGADVAHWAAAHQTALQATMVGYAVGVTLWLAFGLAVRVRLRASGAAPLLADLTGGGLVAMAMLLLVGFTAFDVLVRRADTMSASAAGVLYDLTFGMLAMSGLPAAVGLGAYALAAWRSRALPSYTAVLAAVTALTHAGLIASFIVPRGFWSLEGQVITVVPGLLWLWILLTGIEMMRRPAA